MSMIAHSIYDIEHVYDCTFARPYLGYYWAGFPGGGAKVVHDEDGAFVWTRVTSQQVV